MKIFGHLKFLQYLCIINYLKMTEEKVYSPIKDGNIKKSLTESPILKNCYHKDDLVADPNIMKKYPDMIEYSIKFDGLKPIQVLKVR